MDLVEIPTVPLHPQEDARQATLDALAILDTPPDREFDAITNAAARLFGCKIALVSLVDRDRQWFKSRCGLDTSETGRDVAFCQHVIALDRPLVVPDATKDVRFAMNPLVTDGPKIRFYAGIPLRVVRPDNNGARYPVGTLCIIDDKQHDFGSEQLAQLSELAGVIEALLDVRLAEQAARKLGEAQRRALDSLDVMQRLFRQAERMAKLGSWRLPLSTRRVQWSAETYAIHALTPADSESVERAIEFYAPYERHKIAGALERAIEDGTPYDLELDFTDATGKAKRVRCLGELEMRDDEPVALVGVIQDVTERWMMEQQLRQLANTDELTRLASRSAFNTYIDDQIGHDGPLALLLIDLDNFKTVNDRCGHAAGDDLLRLMASRLQAPYLAGSFAARLGGDEFVMVLTAPEALDNLDHLLARLLGNLHHRMRDAGGSIHTGATIGAARLIAGENRSALMARADAALYRAKAAGRGCAVVAGAEECVIPPADRTTHLRAVG
ncbi:sensor domain-containing diguanylate cyclase [Sphingomonas crocodyli]|uniref:Sensor domain-containing diguanylate cyclase n=1 Tax=Sphingomonas crocodyli TaxID=1979270 RepID=A0A437LUT2_9SPHN|nr:sensor domain-containing diguanylate cyclase [Sphingomonas crocodyli]RVT89136.1 sensor domain-containing diguanylate cyclase [Sphingomonas crocodyli]